MPKRGGFGFSAPEAVRSGSFDVVDGPYGFARKPEEMAPLAEVEEGPGAAMNLLLGRSLAFSFLSQ